MAGSYLRPLMLSGGSLPLGTRSASQVVMHRSISTQGTFRYIRQVDWQAYLRPLTLSGGSLPLGTRSASKGVMHRSISTQGTFRYIRQVDWQALI
ncbi:hypothetical protein N9928_00745 [bacterium]|nr:hypothetical protein [bacterium]